MDDGYSGDDTWKSGAFKRTNRFDEAGRKHKGLPVRPGGPAFVVSAERQLLNSGRRIASCAWRRDTMLECIWLTRDSLRSSVAPISFIVMSS